MSYIATGIVQRRKAGSASLKAVLMLMAGSASDDGTGIWTSKANMAADLEMSKRTVQRSVEALLTAELISEVGQRKCRNGFTVEYRIHLDAIEKLPSTRDTVSPVDTTSRGDTVSPVPPRHLTGDTMSPQEVTPCHPNPTGKIQEPCAAHTQDFDFDRFLAKFEATHPRPGNREETAEQLRQAIDDGVDPGAIIVGAQAYAAEQLGNKTQYIQRSENWVRDRRWEDHLQPAAPSADRRQVLDFWARSIKDKAPGTTTHVTAVMAREMIDLDLVTASECRDAGVAV